MAHPHAEHRQHKVEKSRVAHITKGYASGGGVHSDAAEDKALIRRSVKPSALKMAGDKPKYRADHRARGGRTKHKGTTVNVINVPHGAAGGQMAGLGGPAPMPPGPPMATRPPMPMPPPGGAPGAPMLPPGLPPGMPPRATGGRAYAKGGAVKDGPAWKEGVRNGTQVQNSPGKNDTKDIGRGRVVTFRTGGAVESPKGVAKATKLPGGGGGGEARLAKAKRAARGYAKA